MKKVVISGAAQAVAEDPRSSAPVTDPELLQQLDGASTSEGCSDHLSEELRQVGIHAGYLELAYDKPTNSLRVKTTYRVYGQLSPELLAQLIEETEGQWSDGLGNGSFNGKTGEILSTTLAMALQNSDPSVVGLGSLFVNVYPDIDDRAVRHEMHDAMSPSLISGLAAGVLAVLIGLGIWLLSG